MGFPLINTFSSPGRQASRMISIRSVRTGVSVPTIFTTNPAPGTSVMKKRIGWWIRVILTSCIFGVLAVLGLGALGYWCLSGNVEEAQQVRCEADLQVTVTQLRTFYAINGRFPTTDEGLDALVTRPATMDSSKHWRPLFAELPLDPWGNTYRYVCPGGRPGRSFDVYSLGPDGVPSKDDVYNEIN